MKKVSLIFGTRPEAIKLAPLIRELQAERSLQIEVCVTAQHREMLDQVLRVFDIRPDADLDLMSADQTPAEFASRALREIDGYLRRSRPDAVLVQGDTTTVLCAAQASFYHRIKIGHVEAGLRTGNKHAPFPEEMNRVLTTRLADWHFAPTTTARRHLVDEGIPSSQVWVTGNTVIDALHLALERIRDQQPDLPGVPPELLRVNSGRIVLVTGHRRENQGEGLAALCGAIADLAARYRDVRFVYPVHANPRVRGPVRARLSDLANVALLEPLEYLPFVALLNRATMVLTDSGGLQEESPALGKPVLVVRETTERPEAVAAGTARLVGTSRTAIVAAVSALLDDPEEYRAMARAVNPFGDGRASRRIREILCRQLAETSEAAGEPAETTTSHDAPGSFWNSNAPELSNVA
jgi:UDP-N-acetylglucosamine 2-epimerase (non-hydrolysing)